MEAEETHRSSRAQQSGPVTVDRTKPRRLLFSSRLPPALTSCVRNKTSQILMQLVHITASRHGVKLVAVRLSQVFATGNEVVEAQPLFAMSLRSAM
jgi:hypothetical protein